MKSSRKKRAVEIREDLLSYTNSKIPLTIESCQTLLNKRNIIKDHSKNQAEFGETSKSHLKIHTLPQDPDFKTQSINSQSKIYSYQRDRTEKSLQKECDL